MTLTPVQLQILRERYPSIGVSTLMQNAAVLLANAPPSPAPSFQSDSSAPKNGSKMRLKQHQGDGMNKLERAFLAHLHVTYPDAEHFPQCFSLRLANGAHYRPDFISFFAGESGGLVAWETKGFMREASAVRIKVAASIYKFISFRLVTKKRKCDGGGWQIEAVIP